MKHLKSKKLLSIVLVLVIIFTASASTMAQSNQVLMFSDLKPNHWAYAAVMDMVEKGILSGYQDGTFKPDKPVSRSEYAKILVLALGIEMESETTGTSSFEDVPPSHWAFPYIEAVKSYLTGYKSSDGGFVFKPDDEAIREDIAVTAVKALNFENEKFNLEVLEQFNDKDLISENLKKYVAIAVQKGIMNGTGKGFEPQAPLTRASVCALISRIMPKASGNTYTVAGIDDAWSFELFFHRVKALAEKDDMLSLSKLIDYPISVLIDGKYVEIIDEFDFIQNYNQIFNQRVKNALALQKAEDLFSNWEGVLVGSGEIRFGVRADDGRFCINGISTGENEKVTFDDETSRDTGLPVIDSTDDQGNVNGENLSGASFAVDNIKVSIGETEQSIIEKLGQPARKDISGDGFMWYIYNQDYSKYIQIGINDGKVVGVYSNAAGMSLMGQIKIGTPKEHVHKVLGQPVNSIPMGDYTLFLNSGDESEKFLIDNMGYVTVFYDNHNGDTVTSIEIKDKGYMKKQFTDTEEYQLLRGFEKQIWDLANAIRVRMGKEPFLWDDVAADTARKHSMDMVQRKFFSHYNPDGKSPFERMADDGIIYGLAAENIAAGHESAIYVVESWMNSYGHRMNILGDFERLGVGIEMNESRTPYYTQVFYTPLDSNIGLSW